MSLEDKGLTGWSPAVLARWQFTSVDAGATTVLPDGCRDLILHVSADGQPGCHVSALADAAMHVRGCAGEWWLGFRMRPGTLMDTTELLKSVDAVWKRSRRESGQSDLDAGQEVALLMLMNAHTRLDPSVQEALDALAQSQSVGKAAQSLGVSERSLERLTRRATAQPPRFWRGLARVRRAAQQLVTAQPLAEIAADQGFADQAHFSRDCLRWLGRSPAVLRRSPHLLATVAQAGYG
jgi:AraC-like DNA-binding protein